MPSAPTSPGPSPGPALARRLEALGQTAGSQLHNAWLNRTLWSPRQLLGAARLPLRWAVRRDGSAPDPLAIAWYVTAACPETCSFCNVTQAHPDWQEPLPGPAAARLVDALVPRIPTVALGGGEPMAHPGILDLIARIQRRGGRVFVVTSGTPLGATRARRLAALAPAMVMVSLLGDEATHDALMGRPGAWQRAIAAIEALAGARDRRRTRLLLNCAAGPGNAGSLEAVVRVGRELGVDAVKLTWLSFLTPAERRAEPRPVTYHVLDEGALERFDAGPLLAEARRLEAAHPDLVQLQPRLAPDEQERWFVEGGGVERRCLSLWHTLFLRPDGSVVPCGHLSEQPVADLKRQGLDEAWNAPAMRAVRRAQWEQPFGVCRRCCKV